MNQKFTIALALSVALHLAVGGVLLLGNFAHEAKPKPTPVAAPMEPIQAVAVDKSKVAEQVKKLKNRKKMMLAN